MSVTWNSVCEMTKKKKKKKKNLKNYSAPLETVLSKQKYCAA